MSLTLNLAVLWDAYSGKENKLIINKEHWSWSVISYFGAEQQKKQPEQTSEGESQPLHNFKHCFRFTRIFFLTMSFPFQMHLENNLCFLTFRATVYVWRNSHRSTGSRRSTIRLTRLLQGRLQQENKKKFTLNQKWGQFSFKLLYPSIHFSYYCLYIKNISILISCMLFWKNFSTSHLVQVGHFSNMFYLPEHWNDFMIFSKGILSSLMFQLM